MGQSRVCVGRAPPWTESALDLSGREARVKLKPCLSVSHLHLRQIIFLILYKHLFVSLPLSRIPDLWRGRGSRPPPQINEHVWWRTPIPTTCRRPQHEVDAGAVRGQSPADYPVTSSQAQIYRVVHILRDCAEAYSFTSALSTSR